MNRTAINHRDSGCEGGSRTNVTCLVPSGYHPDAGRESIVDTTKRAIDGLHVLEDLVGHSTETVRDREAPDSNPGPDQNLIEVTPDLGGHSRV
jgi:hypothetical protein